MNQSLPEVTLRPRRIAVDGENSITIKATLDAVVTCEKPGVYVSHCPALEQCSQGDTVEEAETCIAEAVEILLEDSIERNMLDQVLSDCGFRLPGQRAAKRTAKKPPKYYGKVVRNTRFTVELQVKV